MADVVVIGGGVIGLSVAFRLLQAAPDLRVTILDASTLTSGGLGQASDAAAGMLAPFAEAQNAGPLVQLGADSLCRYPEFVESVREAAGEQGDPELRITGAGMLRVARDSAEAARLESLYAWQHGQGFGIERLSAEDARRYEPSLTGEIAIALYSPRERQVEPRRLRYSLAVACCRLGASIREFTKVSTIIRRTGGGFVVEPEAIACENVVIAGGSWSTDILKRVGITLPIAPVKGQILALRPGENSLPPLQHTLYAPDIYLVPRPDGRVIVGATEEPNAGFDVQTHAADIEALRQRAVALVPALADAPLDGPAWAGLRPAAPDHLPILGPLPEYPNAFVATGHFRNGILLAPITGEIIARQILHPTDPHPLLDAAFRPERFLS